MTSELRHPSHFDDKAMIVIVSTHTQNRHSSRKRASTALRTQAQHSRRCRRHLTHLSNILTALQQSLWLGLRGKEQEDDPPPTHSHHTLTQHTTLHARPHPQT